MGVLLFLFGTALAAGLYFVLADLLKIPRLATERALISAGRRERSLVKALEALILGWALKLAPLIRMDEYKYRRLENKLTAAGLDMTPQVYTAYSLLKPCLILLGIIPCLLILPILSPLIVVLAVLTWFKESRRADELVKARMELIEGELPRFVATIHQELAASRDVLRILENYKKHAGSDFGRELDVLTADMRSSSYEAALIRFEVCQHFAGFCTRKGIHQRKMPFMEPFNDHSFTILLNLEKRILAPFFDACVGLRCISL